MFTDPVHNDYIGNLILKNGTPNMYSFAGGYFSFDEDGSIEDSHYYISDYMGNNRMVVNYDGTVEQVTHYYPYGGVIGDLSTNESLQAYKFEGKVLAAIEKIDNLRREDEPLGEGPDRTYGLDWYDIQARQYDALAPTWNAPDPLAEKYYRFSPYNFCGGNPVNFGDYNGMEGDNTSGFSYYTADPAAIAKIFQTYQALYGSSETYEEEDGVSYATRQTYIGYEIGIGIPNPHPTSQDRPIMVADFETNELLYDISLSTELGFIHDWTVKSLDEWNSLDGKSKRELAERIYRNQWHYKYYNSTSNVVKKYPGFLSTAKKYLGPAAITVNMLENINDVKENKRFGVGNALDITVAVAGVVFYSNPIVSTVSLVYLGTDVIMYNLTTPPMHISDWLNNLASFNY